MPIWDYNNPDFPEFKVRYDSVLETLHLGYITQSDKKLLTTKEKIDRLKENRYAFLKKLHEKNLKQENIRKLKQSVKFEPSDSYEVPIPKLTLTKASLRSSKTDPLSSSWRTIISNSSNSTYSSNASTKRRRRPKVI